MSSGNSMPNPSGRVYLTAALITGICVIIAAWIGRSSGISTGQQQAFATVAIQQSGSVAQGAVTQIAETQVAITQIIITQVAITQIVATSPSVIVIATPELPTPGPTLTPTPGPEVLYQADWSKGMEGWAASSSSWKHVNDMLVNDGTDNSQERTMIVAPFRPDDIADYAVEAEVQRVRGRGDNFGIFVRDDGQGAYWVGYEGLPELCNCMSIRSTGNFRESRLTSKEFQPGNDWRTYRVEVKGNTIRLLIDGALLLEATDNQHLSGGNVGLWSVLNQLQVRNFKIIKL